MTKLEEKTEIKVESEYRKCVVYIPAEVNIARSARDGCSLVRTVYKEAEEHKALFHCFAYEKANYRIYGNEGSQITSTYAIVEYEDGTIHKVEPWNIRFVDNAMSEYVFPEMEKNIDKVKNEWKPLKRVNHVCPKCGQGRMKLDEGIVLTSNPPQYRYQCDKCGYVECSSGQIEVSEIDEYEP